MHRPAASIVIPAWNEWARTSACLDVLKPTIGLRDEVIVVDNGSTDATAERLRRHPWARVVTNPENRGFAGGCNDGAAIATGDVVVFLNNDTLPVGRWLDHLLAPFADPAVGATGPRSNAVSGPQLDPSASYASTAELRRHVKAWEAAHRGQVEDADRLVGFCLAVRREAFEAVGRWDEAFGLGGFEDDDLCRRLAAAGHRLVVAHASYVHHEGHATFDGNGLDWFALQQANERVFRAKHAGTTISACLIVKDEEADLPGCLASIEGLVDEVVVHDTGSSDATVALARAAGATVVEGRWDDDFAAARNVALERCASEWILHLDADERLVGDLARLRDELAATQADAVVVGIRNLTGHADAPSATEHRAVRLFRRTRARWEGRIHEQVVHRTGQAPLHVVATAAASVDHHGYLDEVMASRGKAERNLRLAQAAAAGSEQRAVAGFDLGRALAAAGRHAEAVEALAAVDLSLVPLPRQVLRQLAESLVTLERGSEALEVVARLRDRSSRTEVPDLLEGAALGVLGRHEEAVAALLRIGDDVRDDDGVRLQTSTRDLLLSQGLLALDRADEAVERLFGLLATADGMEQVWPHLLRALRAADRSIAEVAAHLPADAGVAALGRLVREDAGAAAELAEALWDGGDRTTRTVALASVAAGRLPVEPALRWSVRLRSEGHPDACPLLTAVGPAGDRVLKAAAAAAAFDDPRAATVAQEAILDVAADELAAAFASVGELAPGLLPGLVTAAATGGDRTRAVAAALASLGAAEQAELLMASA